MKDYYAILGVPENAAPEEIKSAFRRLAFQYHPDKNPGNEKQASERFKEINEAYSVLCDESRRREYDACRRGAFAGTRRASTGFDYTQEEIFRRAFASEALYQELLRMFAQMGLRFDEDFRNRVFFGGRGIRFEFRVGSWESPVSGRTERVGFGEREPSCAKGRQPAIKRPNWIERKLFKMLGKLTGYLLRKALGAQPILPARGRDIQRDLTISAEEARLGCCKKIRYKRGREKKTLEVTVPAGIVSGMRIKLRGMGEVGEEPGDLYLRITVKPRGRG